VCLTQLGFQARQLRRATADELELTVDVTERLAQQLAPARRVDIVPA